MVKKATRRSKASVEVTVTRFNEPDHVLTLGVDATIDDALQEAGISLGATEIVWVNGDRANNNDTVEDDDIIQVVGKKDGGNDGEEEEPKSKDEPSTDEESEEEAA